MKVYIVIEHSNSDKYISEVFISHASAITYIEDNTYSLEIGEWFEIQVMEVRD